VDTPSGVHKSGFDVVAAHIYAQHIGCSHIEIEERNS
jgi:hypothetical protein